MAQIFLEQSETKMVFKYKYKYSLYVPKSLCMGIIVLISIYVIKHITPFIKAPNQQNRTYGSHVMILL